jgi:hypothetical protein
MYSEIKLALQIPDIENFVALPSMKNWDFQRAYLVGKASYTILIITNFAYIFVLYNILEYQRNIKIFIFLIFAVFLNLSSDENILVAKFLHLRGSAIWYVSENVYFFKKYQFLMEKHEI